MAADAPLLAHARKGNLAKIEALFEADPDLQTDVCNDNGWSALHYASGGGHLAAMEFLVKKGANISLVERTAGWNVLHIACYAGRKEVVMFLLKHVGQESFDEKARDEFFNKKDKHGSTPLILACLKGVTKDHEEIVSNLLAAGVNVFSKTSSGKTAVDVATNDAIRKLVEDHMKTVAADPSFSPDSPTVGSVPEQSSDDDEAGNANGEILDTPVTEKESSQLQELSQRVDVLQSTPDGADSAPDSGVVAVPAETAPTEKEKQKEPAKEAAAPPPAAEDDETAAKMKMKAEAEEELLRYLRHGSWLLKHTKDGKGPVHRRYFRLSDANLSWAKSPDASKWKTAYVYDVVVGARPAKFSGNLEIFHNKNLWKMTSFAFKTSLGNIHLVAETMDMYRVWAGGSAVVLSRVTNQKYDLTNLK